MSESGKYPLVPLSEALSQDRDYITELEPRLYNKLSVRLYGRGVVLDEPADGATVRMKRHQLAKPRQVILSEIWAKRGAIGIVPEEGGGALVTSHFFLFNIDESKLLQPYMAWLLAANYFEPALSGKARGTTGYAAVRPKQFLECKIPLPSPDKQRRIVARIEELAVLIEEAQALRAKAREEADMLWQSYAEVLLDDLAQGGVERLQDLVTLQGGGTPSRANPFYWKGSIPWIRPQNMKTREIKDSTDRITQEAIRNSSAKLLPAGAVLVVVRGMILAHTVPAAVLRVPAAVNQDMKALIPAEGLAPEYLNTSLWALNRRLLSFVERSTHGTCRLRTQDLLDFTIPVPPLAEQHRLVATLDGLRDWVDELTASQDATQAELDALLPSILDQAFKGEL